MLLVQGVVMKDTQGLTLISMLVAIGLTGVVAVTSVTLINNQMTAKKVLEIIDKRSAIVNFYSNIMRDGDVWKCTLNHKTGGSFTNADLRNYVINLNTFVGSGGVTIVAPDCATVLVAATGKMLGDSITAEDANGWWTIAITWQGMGKGGVDISLEVSLDKDRFDAQHSFKLKQLIKNQTIKVHHSENTTQGNSCEGSDYEEAVTGINLHTAADNRKINCSGNRYRIVQLATKSGCSPPHLISNITPKGEIICSAGVAVTPFPSSNNAALRGLGASGNFFRDATRVLIEDIDCSSGAVEVSSGGLSCDNNPQGPPGEPGCDWPYAMELGGNTIEDRIDVSEGVSIPCPPPPSPPDPRCYNPGGSCNSCQHPICASLNYPHNGAP